MSFDKSWPSMTLKDAGVTLIDCDHRTPVAQESGFPYIAIPQLKDGHVRLDGSERRISPEDFVDWTKKLKPQEHDVIVVRRCNSGDSAVVPKNTDWAIGQNLVVLRSTGELVHPPFLRWLLRGEEWWEQVGKYINVGAVFDSLKCREIPLFELTIPPIANQIEIAQLLAALDDRITLLRQTNATLEAIAQALFKSWFVDFDPVHAKQAGQAPNGMDEATAALFPNRFTESPLGLVPEGWRVEPLDAIADFLNGLALQKFPADGDNNLPVIKIAQLRKGDTVGADLANRKIKPEYIIQNGDVLFSWSGSLEVEVWCGGEGALNQHLFKVTSQRFKKWFYLLWTKHHLAEFRQIAASKATTMGHIQRKHLSEALVIVPSPEALSEADKVFAPLLEQLINNALQAQTLATLRDTLLPRLISGQLRLPDSLTDITSSL